MKFRELITEGKPLKGSVQWLEQQIKTSKVFKEYIEKVLKEPYSENNIDVVIRNWASYRYYGELARIRPVNKEVGLSDGSITINYNGKKIQFEPSYKFFVAGNFVGNTSNNTLAGVKYSNWVNAVKSDTPLYLADAQKRIFHTIYLDQKSYEVASSSSLTYYDTATLTDEAYSKVVKEAKKLKIAESIFDNFENELKKLLPEVEEVDVDIVMFFDNKMSVNTKELISLFDKDWTTSNFVYTKSVFEVTIKSIDKNSLSFESLNSVYNNTSKTNGYIEIKNN